MTSTGSGAPARRVLVVDDDDDIREVAKVALTVVGGWQVMSASSGREALEVASSGLPDAILLDVMMPDMDGPATIAQLKRGERTHAIPIILLTAKVQSHERPGWADLDLAGVIAKPFDPMSLPSEMASLLGWAQ